MMTAISETIDWTDAEAAARRLAGNWREFQSFIWLRGYDLPDADRWLIWYTGGQDSGLLTQSNSDATAKRLAPFLVGDDPDVVAETHGHWAVGSLGGLSLRVYRGDGSISQAFAEFCRVQEALDNYPVLDEEGYGELEYASTLANYASEMWPRRGELPPGWEAAVYGWFEGHGKDCFIESRDDRGGYAPREALLEALEELRLVPVAAVPM